MKLVFTINIHILVNICIFFGCTTWIKALYNRATKICSNQKLLDGQTKKTLSSMSLNESPNYVSKPLLGRLKSSSATRITSSI